MMKRLSFLTHLVLVGLVLSSLVVSPAEARSTASTAWYVSPAGSDANTCRAVSAPCATINGAIDKAAAGDTIYIAEGVYSSSEAQVVTMNKDLTLSGGWNNAFTAQPGYASLDGQNQRRGVWVGPGITTTIIKVRIVNGNDRTSYRGSGIYVDESAFLSLYDSIIQDSKYYSAMFVFRSRAEVYRTTIKNSRDGIHLINSTLRFDSSLLDGGYMGMVLAGKAVIENSTIRGFINGGVLVMSCSNAEISNSTITENGYVGLSSSTTCYNPDPSVQPLTLLRNTLVAANIGNDCDGTFQSAGYNLLGSKNTCTNPPAAGDKNNADPKLGALQDNSGPTFTYALLPGSPAINAGNPAGCAGSKGALTTDQRGAVRKGICDIGAYEAGGAFVSLSASSIAALFGQPVTFTAQVTASEGPLPTGTISFEQEGVSLGSASLNEVGTAQFTTSSLSLGRNQVIAVYSGDYTYAAGVSPTAFVHMRAASAVTVTSDSPDPSVTGQTVVVEMTVTSLQSTPTGEVLVTSDASSDSCRAALVNGAASCPLTFTRAGSHHLTAQYLGDDSFNPAVSTAETHTVNKANTVTTITVDTVGYSSPWEPFPVLFTVAAQSPGAGKPTGKVTVHADEGPQTCEATLTDGAGFCTLPLYKPGAHTLTATYSGDGSYLPSTSAPSPRQVHYQCFLAAGAKPCFPLYSDDFSNPNSGWPVGKSGGSAAEYKNGEYRMYLQYGYSSLLVRPGMQVDNAVISVDVNNRRGVNGSYGIFFGASEDWDVLYSFEIYSNGAYGVYYFFGENMMVLGEGKVGSLYRMNDWNNLKVVQSGNSAQLYLNNQLLRSVGISSSPNSRYVGFDVFSYDQADLEVYFDNFAIYPLECGAKAGLNHLELEGAASSSTEMGSPGRWELPFERQEPAKEK